MRARADGEPRLWIVWLPGLLTLAIWSLYLVLFHFSAIPVCALSLWVALLAVGTAVPKCRLTMTAIFWVAFGLTSIFSVLYVLAVAAAFSNFS